MVPFGPGDDRLPERFTGTFERQDSPVKVSVVASFAGADRVKVESLTVERTDGQSVTPTDVSRLKPAGVMYLVVTEAMEPKWSRELLALGKLKGLTRPGTDELETIARSYWRTYVAWGEPRRALMTALEIPRTTANRWIRRAADLYGLPGPHRDGGQ